MEKTKILVFWDPYEENLNFSRASFFTDLFQKNEDVVTIDLKNNKDPRSLQLLREADLVVVFIKQNEFCLNRYFVTDMVKNENIVYVIVDFILDGISDWRRALDRYRIPEEQLFVLPFDPRLQLFEEPEEAKSYLEEAGHSGGYASLMNLTKCYQQVREKIRYSLE